MLLKLEQISKFYNAKAVFKKISFELDAGQILLLTGPNGAGKSTLLRIIAGLTEASNGKVTLNLKKNGLIGYMGQESLMYPDLSALENLTFWTRFYGLSHTAGHIADTLERLDLGSHSNKKAATFSQGMLKRLNLALITLLSPALLLLDEPENSLDSASRAMLLDETTAATANGAAVIWISHSPDKLLPHAHQVAELGPGVNKYSELTCFRPASTWPRPGQNMPVAGNFTETPCMEP
jgi:heme exporter protein A